MSTAQGGTVIGYPVGAHQVATGNPSYSNSNQLPPARQVATANPYSNSDRIRPARGPTSTRNDSTTDHQKASRVLVSRVIRLIMVITLAVMIPLIALTFFQVDLPDFKVESGTVTSALNGTAASEWDIILLAKNKVSLKSLKALVFYRKHKLELQPSPASTPIVLKKEARQHMKLHVTGGDVGEFIDDDRRNRGFMSFPVIRVRACFGGNRAFFLFSGRCHRVYCGPLHFVFSPDGTTATSLEQTECYYPGEHPHS